MDENSPKFKRDVTSLYDKLKEVKGVDNVWDKVDEFEYEDGVNNPYHYTRGRVEAIDVIEDAIKEAPNTMNGFLQGQVLKYMLRLWHKVDAKEDAQKARWYLNRLIDSLN